MPYYCCLNRLKCSALDPFVGIISPVCSVSMYCTGANEMISIEHPDTTKKDRKRRRKKQIIEMKMVLLSNDKSFERYCTGTGRNDFP